MVTLCHPWARKYAFVFTWGVVDSDNPLQIFVRALDLDERLVGVAFLDVGVYVTSLRSLKNLLLIGDVAKSVWLVAFQVRASHPFPLYSS